MKQTRLIIHNSRSITEEDGDRYIEKSFLDYQRTNSSQFDNLKHRNFNDLEEK